MRGVGGTSSILTRPLCWDLVDRKDPLTDLGNSLRRGVKAVTTLFADFRMVSLTFHSFFFARKKRTALPTVGGRVNIMSGQCSIVAGGQKRLTTEDGDDTNNHNDGDQTTLR